MDSRIRLFLLIGCLAPLTVLSQKWVSPLYQSHFGEDTTTSLVYPSLQKSTLTKADTSYSYLQRKLFQEHFVRIKKKDLRLAINPLMNVYGGTSTQKDNLIYRNTRGVEVRGAIGKYVSFKSSFYETQLNSPGWIDEYYSKYGVLPGETSAKGYGDDGYDIGSVYGTFIVTQSWGEWDVLFRGGYDNLFIGEGFRSLFLSDYSLPFLHGGVAVEYQSLKYLHLSASLQNPNHRNIFDLETSSRPSTAPYQKKTMALHYLRWSITNNIQIGFFEGAVYQVSDSSKRNFSLQYVNPLPLANVSAYGLDDKNNVVLGADLHIAWSKNLSSYVQWLQDTRNSEGSGLLASIRYRTPSFKLLLEGTHTGSKVLAHHDPRQSYTHYNQPLAHPAGAGVDEAVFETGYRSGRFEAEGRIILQQKQKGIDYGSPLEGADDYINHTFYEGGLRYVLNPKTRLQVFTSIMFYKRGEEQETFFRFGIKTQLRREYLAVTR